MQAVIPLTLFMTLVFIWILREKIPRPDEIIFGIVMAVLGMGLFNVGMQTGLARIGNQVGSMLPASFTSIALEDRRETINNFSTNGIIYAMTEKGAFEPFFLQKKDKEIEPVPFVADKYDPQSGTYLHEPRVGPLFGTEYGWTGSLVVLLFALVMGYGATLAEPALKALGIKVEDITVGTFKQNQLMQSVAVGVGIGLAFGMAKIIWDVSLSAMLVPPYLLVLWITWISDEEYVNIAWDSAGVTTGPITVPLVLAMGLGVGNQVGAIEGFGILAMASVYPILAVLLTGIYAKRRQAPPGISPVSNSTAISREGSHAA